VVAVTRCFGIATIYFDFIATLIWHHPASERGDAVAEGTLLSPLDKDRCSISSSLLCLVDLAAPE
jgi:hypothetical protein